MMELALPAGFRPNEFPSASREQWRELVDAVLAKTGASFESLVTRTYDGIELQPLYTLDDALPPYALVPAKQGWDVRQRHTVPDPVAVMNDLEGGVTSLWLALPASSLERVLDGVYLDLAPIVLDGDVEAARTMLRIYDQAPLLAEQVRGNLALRPHGPSLDVIKQACRQFPSLRTVVVDALPFHDAGGSDSEELGASIALAVSYLRALTDAGLDVAQAFAQLEFRYAATADQFMTIAKLRAARRLWARVAEVSGADAPQVQHAVTSSAMMTRRDPWVNMLRTTVATLAAGLGGADSVTVQPFDAAIGLPDEFARRIARNTQNLLLEESHLGEVIDPAAGSWYVEKLTDELAGKAWAWFQEIERAGGLPAAGSLVASRIASTWEKRSARLADRSDPITGVSEFPNLTEKPVVREPAVEQGSAHEPAVEQGPARDHAVGIDPDSQAPRGDAPPIPSFSGGSDSFGLPRVRYAQAFEELRDLADAQPERPQVFLATLGPVAAHTARATFAANLFNAGGFATPNAGPTRTAEDVVEKFKASGARIAVVCGSDSSYADLAVPTVEALRAAGAERVLLAGRKSDADVDGHVYMGCPALQILNDTFEFLGVRR
ncbi:heterodimeric methylmalonyl-CoA mutase small subunit [Lentzea atacamensis]|uniref:Heterodimeric methylmalonyl-CoA mutase small subunit n=1 Tax=Lentzea atacamensis TaxID=531938 RepID=A0ABX9EE74_9PSEU|nr:methylmalonyl-CoA mutase family protein [Lentzea atacamensis]RAS68957.1 heterodimeric methylmalonyl-CoA mutase small subunit [Lentzea atacamensis]